MIYGQDAPIAFPVADLYDSGIMQMYVNAVRDQYQQGLKDYETFMSKYGDFTSPIAKDVDYWNDKVMGPTVNMIDAMYAQGIDPMRNPEARAMIQRSVRNVPYVWVNKARQRKAAAEEYVKNRAALQRAGKWSPEFESYILGGKSLETWDPEVDGDWTRTSPTEYETLQSFVHPSFKDLKPHALSKEEVESKGYKYDPRNDYKGITKGDMERSMRSALPGLVGNEKYGFFKEQARQELLNEHANDPNYIPTDAEVTERFIQNAITADSQVMTPFDYEANDWAKMEQQKRNQMALDDHSTANDIGAYKQKAAVDHYYTMLENGADADGDGKITKGEAKAWSAAGGKGGKGNKNVEYNIFREAERKGHTYAGFEPQDAYDLKIDPANDGVEFVKGKEGEASGWRIRKGMGKNLIYKHYGVYSKQHPSAVILDENKDYTFISTGALHARTNRNGKTTYYVSGVLKREAGTDKDGNPKFELVNNGETFEMRVQERDHDYGK